MKLYIVHDKCGVLEGVYSSEKRAREAFSNWEHLELRETILDRGSREYPFSSPLRQEDR